MARASTTHALTLPGTAHAADIELIIPEMQPEIQMCAMEFLTHIRIQPFVESSWIPEILVDPTLPNHTLTVRINLILVTSAQTLCPLCQVNP